MVRYQGNNCIEIKCILAIEVGDPKKSKSPLQVRQIVTMISGISKMLIREVQILDLRKVYLVPTTCYCMEAAVFVITIYWLRRTLARNSHRTCKLELVLM